MARSKATTLTLTGECDRRRTLVLVAGRQAWLSERPFEALCRLAAARLDGAGFRREAPLTIRRLRETFDLVGGEGTGARLIETGAGGRYRLALEASSIRCVASLWRRLSPQRSMWRTLAALKKHLLKSR